MNGVQEALSSNLNTRTKSTVFCTKCAKHGTFSFPKKLQVWHYTASYNIATT
nr:MAG TPA: hypothetical protein [Caudoviricetes sp.]